MRSHTLLTTLLLSTAAVAKIAYERFDADLDSVQSDADNKVLNECFNDNYIDSILGKEEDARILAEETNSTDPLCGGDEACSSPRVPSAPIANQTQEYGIPCRCWNSRHTQANSQS